MITNYDQTKNEVLKMQQDVISIFDEWCDLLRNESMIASIKKSMIALANQAENIRNDKFSLMVAGEGKSGKSTFINAFLGTEILPMDIKQCTSAIIEIRHGDEYMLTARYADGKSKIILGEKEIKEFLEKNAALNDDYRDIPVTTINNEIILKYKGKTITNKVIGDLIEGVQSENIYQLPADVYEKKIREYIDEKKENWADIVTTMIITYPIGFGNLRGMEIIDSPGVNVQGRVGDITNEYIENANAIMFLKPLTGAALESVSFRNFINTKSVDRNKNALFLVLTRAANENLENLERSQQEALKLYGKTVAPEQIIAVDSKVQLFINRISNMSVEEIENYLDQLESSGKLDAFIAPPRSMRLLDKDRYIEYLKTKSKFSAINHALNIFGRKTHYLALSELLGRMLKVCQRINDNLEDQIKWNKLKAKDPTELQGQINDIKEKLDEINVKMGKNVDEIVTLYTGDSGIIRARAKDAMEDFTTRIEKIGNYDINELEKVSFHKIDEAKNFQAELQKKFVAECNAALIALSNEKEIRYTALEPDFTPEMFEELKREAESHAHVEKSYTTGFCFKKTHNISVYSPGEHFKKTYNRIQTRIKSIQDEAINNLIDFTNQTAATYTKELAANAQAKKDELDRIIKEKEDAEEIQKSIESMQMILEWMDPLVKAMKERKEGIDVYV